MVNSLIVLREHLKGGKPPPTTPPIQTHHKPYLKPQAQRRLVPCRQQPVQEPFLQGSKQPHVCPFWVFTVLAGGGFRRRGVVGSISFSCAAARKAPGILGEAEKTQQAFLVDKHVCDAPRTRGQSASLPSRQSAPATNTPAGDVHQGLEQRCHQGGLPAACGPMGFVRRQ